MYFRNLLAHLFLFLAVHETSKRLSQTLRDVYESDWEGAMDLSVITEVSSWPQSGSVSLSGRLVWKSPGSLITSGSAKETGTQRPLKFLFYNLHRFRGSWIPVSSSLSFPHLEINLPELLQAGQSETWLICVCWGGKAKKKLWTEFSFHKKQEVSKSLWTMAAAA